MSAAAEPAEPANPWADSVARAQIAFPADAPRAYLLRHSEHLHQEISFAALDGLTYALGAQIADLAMLIGEDAARRHDPVGPNGAINELIGAIVYKALDDIKHPDEPQTRPAAHGPQIFTILAGARR